MSSELCTTTEHDLTVRVRELTRGYGSGSGKVEVLKDLRMSVPAGSIYGLLGPSGCGKTTLLRCIIGRLAMERGVLTTLGKVPGSIGHNVPGSMVGYMPQELALYERFTIGETLRYFGRLHCMTSSRIVDRTTFLLDFLHLPKESSLIANLSGGQKRRVSFAVALLHEPELLILDEPTVGVDPVLRQRIWEHLIAIAQSSNTTIMITTHYVEEARQAHVVGLMRNGRLLAEAPPDELLKTHNLDSLEDVFLKLCQLNHDDHDRSMDVIEVSAGQEHQENADERQQLTSSDHLAHYSNESNASSEQVIIKDHHSILDYVKYAVPKPNNTFALTLKNFTNYKRNIGFLLFQFMLPSIQMILFCLCIGGEPYHLPIGISNNDSTHLPLPPYAGRTAGELYQKQLDTTTFTITNYSSESECLQTVRDGKSWACLKMGPSFTTDLMKRFSSQGKLDNSTIEGGSIHVYFDTTSMMIYTVMQAKILEAYQDFQIDLLTKYQYLTHINPAAAELPVRFEEPIYGNLDPQFTDFMAAGIILSITFFMATGLTAFSFVTEKKDGLLDRGIVAGVGYIEIMISHICTQFLIMAVQVGLLLIFALLVFKVTNEGSLLLVIILTLFQGFIGMALGMVISSLCDTENASIQACMASMYPSMLLSGIIWPIEAMPVWLQHISVILPMTLPAQSIRAIMGRGWGITYYDVWIGYVISIGWGWGLMIIAGIIVKVRSV